MASSTRPMAKVGKAKLPVKAQEYVGIIRPGAAT